MAVSTVLDRKVFRAGTAIFREGTTGSTAFVVQSGRVRISKRKGEDEVVLGDIGPGGIFGEMALIDNQPRMAAATAVEDTVCIVVSEEAFRDKLRRADPFLRALVNILVADVRRAGEEKVRRIA